MTNEAFSIGSIGFSTNSISGGAVSSGSSEKEKDKEKTAYMGPSIGNLLNGSANPPSTASAVRA